MDQENSTVIHLEFDNQTFNTCVEVMEPLAVNALGRHECIALFAHNRQELVDRAFTVLTLVRRIHAEMIRDDFGLVLPATANGPAIHFYQADNIRIHRIDELNNLVQVAPVTNKVTSARQGYMHGSTAADTVSNVVEQKSHGKNSPITRRRVQRESVLSLIPAGKKSMRTDGLKSALSLVFSVADSVD